MVRNYKKKGVCGNFKPEVVDAAVSAVKTKLMSVRDAAKEFGIPPTTLPNWVHSKVKHFHLYVSILRLKVDENWFFFF